MQRCGMRGAELVLVLQQDRSEEAGCAGGDCLDGSHELRCVVGYGGYVGVCVCARQCFVKAPVERGGEETSQ